MENVIRGVDEITMTHGRSKVRVAKTPDGDSHRWMVYIDDVFVDHFPTDSAGISHARELLSRPLRREVIFEDISDGKL